MRAFIPNTACRAATFCALLGGLEIVLLHVVRPDLNPLHRFVSEYAVDVNGSHWGWLMQAVFLTLAACSSIVATIVRGRAAWALGIGAIGMLVMFASPTDLNVAPILETPLGRIHDFTALTTFAIFLVAMLNVALKLGPAERKAKKTAPRIAFFFFAFGALTISIQIALLATQTRPYSWAGVTERVLIGTLLAWCIWLSNSARSICFEYPSV